MSVGKFFRFSAVAFGLSVMPNISQAADLYGGYKDEPRAVQALMWQGFYIGGFGGWAWSSIAAANNAVVLSNAGSVPFGTSGTNGLFGGAQIGYNVQSSIFVYGIEADFAGLDDSAARSFVDPYNAARTISVTSSSGFYGDITGRAGLTFGNALIYAKGGFAFFTGNVRVMDTYYGIYQDSGTFTGWTVGGGIEYQITPNLTVKAEYQYFDVDNQNFSCCLAGFAGRLDDNISANTLKIGFNYLLHGLRSPLN